MKIRNKISLLSAVFLITLVVAVTAVTVFTIRRNAEADIAKYREQALAAAKASVKDKVTMVYDVVKTKYATMNERQNVEKVYGSRVRNVVEIAIDLLNELDKQVQAGELTLKDAQAIAKKRIANLRFEEGNVGYLWINDMQRPFPRMVMHPTQSHLDGTVLDSKTFNTANRRKENLYVAAVNIAEATGSGFYEYDQYKPTKDGKLTDLRSKVSYVSLFKPWGWVVASGVYLDDVQTESVEQVKDIVSLMRYQDGEGYFWINDTTKPFPKMIMHPISPQLNGQVLNSSKWNTAMGRKENLFVAALNVTSSPRGEGFIDYMWPKPTPSGLTADQPKISFVKVFKPLNWIIGSGIYIDNIDIEVAAKRKEVEEQVRNLMLIIIGVAGVVLLFSLIVMYVFAVGMSKSIEELTEVAEEISLGKGLDTEIKTTGRNDEIGQLARAIERLQTSVQVMMKRMKKK